MINSFSINQMRPDLTAFIKTFDALSEDDQRLLRKRIEQGASGEIAIVEPDRAAVPLRPGGEEIHSCYICRQLVFHRSTTESHTDIRFLDTDTLTLTKDSLRQGIAHKCILVGWILPILARGLRDFKSELAKSVNDPSQVGTTHDVADDLQYISAEGLTISCQSWERDGQALMRVEYEAEPYLIDRLWDAAHDLRAANSYQSFAIRCDGSIKAPFRAIFPSGDSELLQSDKISGVQSSDFDKQFRLARLFLNDCQKGHEKCYRNKTKLPSRVIDVGTKSPIQSVRLYWSGDDECEKYAALSYCWGGPQPLNTTFATAQDNTDGIVFSALPRTLQDAMIVTFELGLRYIWIDSLCIFQDDPDDLSREIANMTNIFRGAFVTISAARSSSVHHGFLNDQLHPKRTRVALPFRSTSTKHGTMYLEQGHRAYDPEEDPINLRAWTLQEHILPHRMLIFGSRQMWWTCEGSIGFDNTWSAKRVDEIPAVQHKTSPDRYSIDYWRSIVRDYTRRFLTLSNDKLPAIAGVADLYSQFFNSRYLAGLWESSLLEELMWCSVRADISRPVARRAPSWSWASVDGEVHHNWCPTTVGADAPKIIKCDIRLVSDASPFGPVDASRCILHVESRLIKAFWQSDRKYISLVTGHQMTTNAETGEVEEVDVYRASHTHGGRTHADSLESDSPTEVWVLPITTDPVRGLLLARVEGHTYRRVGIVSRMWSKTSMPEDMEIRRLSII